MKNVVANLNLPRIVAHHVVGKDHTVKHRMIAGLVVMGAGVLVAKQAFWFENVMFHMTVDLIGYAIHGLGLTPYVEWLLKLEGE